MIWARGLGFRDGGTICGADSSSLHQITCGGRERRYWQRQRVALGVYTDYRPHESGQRRDACATGGLVPCVEQQKACCERRVFICKALPWPRGREYDERCYDDPGAVAFSCRTSIDPCFLDAKPHGVPIDTIAVSPAADSAAGSPPLSWDGVSGSAKMTSNIATDFLSGVIVCWVALGKLSGRASGGESSVVCTVSPPAWILGRLRPRQGRVRRLVNTAVVPPSMKQGEPLLRPSVVRLLRRMVLDSQLHQGSAALIPSPTCLHDEDPSGTSSLFLSSMHLPLISKIDSTCVVGSMAVTAAPNPTNIELLQRSSQLRWHKCSFSPPAKCLALRISMSLEKDTGSPWSPLSAAEEDGEERLGTTAWPPKHGLGSLQVVHVTRVAIVCRNQWSSHRAMPPSSPSPSLGSSQLQRTKPMGGDALSFQLFLAEAARLGTGYGELDSSHEALIATIKRIIMMPVWLRAVANPMDTTGSKYTVSLPQGLLLSGSCGVGKKCSVRRAVHEINAVADMVTTGLSMHSIEASVTEEGVCTGGERKVRAPLRTVPVKVKLFFLKGAEVLSQGIGDAEAEIRRIFADAYHFTSASPDDRDNVRAYKLAVVFIDEIDMLCNKRDSGNSTAHSSARVRRVAQLLSLMDAVTAPCHRCRILVVGATSRTGSVDEALRRPGRFDKEYALTSPRERDRLRLIRRFFAPSLPFDAASFTLRRSLPYSKSSKSRSRTTTTALPPPPRAVAGASLGNVSSRSVGFLAVDIAALVREAFLLCLHLSSEVTASTEPATCTTRRTCKFFGGSIQDRRRSFLRPSSITVPSIRECMSRVISLVRNSTNRHLWLVNATEGGGTRRWFEGIGGCRAVKVALRKALEWPQLHSGAFTRLGLSGPKGVLLHGPPGCAKTLLVRAVALCSGATFVSLSAVDVYSPMMGDAEATVRRGFSLARRAPPALLFFDEIDALVGDRGTPGGSPLKVTRAAPLSVEARVLSTFLNELDGIEAKHQNEVTVVAATNRPDCLDAAILRPGRLESLISVRDLATPPLHRKHLRPQRNLLISDFVWKVSAPDEGARRAILAVHLRSVPFGRFVNIEALSTTTSGFAGADLMGVCREAALERVLV